MVTRKRGKPRHLRGLCATRASPKLNEERNECSGNQALYCEQFATSYGRFMTPSMIRLRRAWFQIHKWIGIVLAILIIPLSLSGAALVWHDWLDEQVNPQRYPKATSALLAPTAYIESASKLLKPGERIVANPPASYYKVLRKASPLEIETVDMARRAIHDRGTRQLLEALEGKVETDFATARSDSSPAAPISCPTSTTRCSRRR